MRLQYVFQIFGKEWKGTGSEREADLPASPVFSQEEVRAFILYYFLSTKKVLPSAFMI